MRRRQVIKLGLWAAVLLAQPRRAQADGETTMAAGKGFVCNDETPANVAALKPDWFHIQFGEWCWTYANAYPCDWTLALYDYVPQAGEVELAVQHNAYGGQWMVGHNEADLAGWLPNRQANLIRAQMQAVQAVDSGARFAIEGGTQLHPLFADDWFSRLWSKFTPQEKIGIKVVHVHFYAQQQVGDNARALTAQPIVDYMTQVRAGLTRLGFTGRLWVTEIGLAQTDYTLANADKVAQYPATVQAAMDAAGVNRWAWYSQSKQDGYVTLQSNGVNSAIGNCFAGL